MSRRTLAIVVAGALLVAVGAVIAVQSLRSSSRYESASPDAAGIAAEAVAPAPDADAPESKARVESVEGSVTVRRDGVESPVVAGAELEADDILATAADGRTILRVDDETKVVLDAGTTVTWGAITDSLSSVQLEHGFLSAETGREGGRVFRVQALDRTADVETSAGAFDVASDARQLAVAAASGEIAVRSGGETVRVAAGSYTTVERGRRPATPRQLPGDVVAEIFWPGESQEGGDRLVAERSVVVRGKLGGGLSGVLTIRNERTGQTYRVVARADGSFETRVELVEDQPNPLVVAGRAIGGRPVDEQRATVLQDSTPPPLDVRIH